MKTGEIKSLAERYGITLVYLFGSQAIKGRNFLNGEDTVPEEHSDLDIAIAFKDIPSKPLKTYGELFKELSEIFEPFIIDLVFIHEMDILMQYEIVRGERIYEFDNLHADEFEENVMKRAEDLAFKKRIFNQEILEAIENGYFTFEYNPHS
jgi:predicted nucleotidyltransferase